ncbi:MAG: glucosamine-6-phosphate deaminase [Planctomycetes bacterium]|nr:glucosamine-6-phosphate deaminase [Planctomycetota bacterium]
MNAADRFLARRSYASSAPGGTPVSVYDSSSNAAAAVAQEIATLIRSKAAAGKKAVLGLATGSTPTGVYDELVRLHQQEGLSFRNVVTFNLDEYWPMQPDALQSYRRFMAEHLFDHIDIDPKNVNIPDGTLPLERVAEFCAAYEDRIAQVDGLDLQILGIGRTGHIGFNEPGSPRESRTRLITLDKVTRKDAASDFFGEWNVPRRAITMGVGTILRADRILLLAWGESKARIIRQALEGEVSQAVAASFLQEHANVEFVLDRSAAGELTPVKTPWLLGPVSQRSLRWNERLTRRAVIWLAQALGKPILKLIEEDYNEHGLQELLSERGAAYDVNIEVFKSMQATITGWPGGKPRTGRVGSPDLFQHASDQYPKRVIVFSPHPDDDVISMGGTFVRLCEQDHEVHVAYQTSGNIAVFDDEAVRFADFVAEFARTFELFGAADVARIEKQAAAFVTGKRPGEIDSPELQRIKALIRRSEARAAARFCGVASERIHFLDMPFYETGRVRKKPLGPRDVEIVAELLERVRPHQIYAAGDLSDPHGTHRVCLRAVVTAVEKLSAHDWMRSCEFWLYRGAWQEWEPERIEMAVPLSPDEVERKRMAIFKHQSQKDKALFPGPSDMREFWQRAEDRNRETAQAYDRLGLSEYQAIEAFVRWKPGMF